ncbi:transposase family protein, partial [Chungangia koreensis]
MNIPGLEDVTVTKMEQIEDRVAIHVEMERRFHTCPSCGGKTRKMHDYRLQKISHLKLFDRLTCFIYKKRRYVCGQCGKRFAEKNTIVERYKRSSIEGNQSLAIRCVQAKTFKEVALQYGTSATTVIRRFDELAHQEVSAIKELPRAIAM